jgi:hypothetical protein
MTRLAQRASLLVAFCFSWGADTGIRRVRRPSWRISASMIYAIHSPRGSCAKVLAAT